MTNLELQFITLWDSLYPDIKLEPEYRFSERRYRLDFAHVPSKIGIEINGGIWGKGGHSSGSGISRDYEKNNLAIVEGWRVFQLSSKMINCEVLRTIALVICTDKAKP